MKENSYLALKKAGNARILLEKLLSFQCLKDLFLPISLVNKGNM